MKEQKRYKRWINAVLKKNYGRCSHCGKKPTGGIHHIIGRGCKKTKYVVENGIPTCFKFHRMWEKPVIERELIRKYVGVDKYNLLRKVANGIIDIKETNFTEVI